MHLVAMRTKFIRSDSCQLSKFISIAVKARTRGKWLRGGWWGTENDFAPGDCPQDWFQQDKETSYEERREDQASASVGTWPPSCVGSSDQRGQQEYRASDATERVHDLQEDWPEPWVNPLGIVGDNSKSSDQAHQDDADQAEYRVGRCEMMSVAVDLVRHDDDQTDQHEGQTCRVQDPVHRHPVHSRDLVTEISLPGDAVHRLCYEKTNSKTHADGMPGKEWVISKC